VIRASRCSAKWRIALVALGEATGDAIADDVDLPKATVRRYLKTLRDDGRVVREGNGKRGDPYRWRALEDEAA
jgi:predicted ArsR family transcriptional regulator